MAGEEDQAKWVGTRKVHPAIADLQAIEAVYQFDDIFPSPPGGVVDRFSGTVPGGKMWIASYIMSYCNTLNDDELHSINTLLVVDARLNYAVNLPVNAPMVSSGTIVLDEGQRIRFRFVSVAPAGTCVSSMAAYQVSKY